VDALDALISERPYRSSPFFTSAAIDLLLDEAEKRNNSIKVWYDCTLSPIPAEKAPALRIIDLAKEVATTKLRKISSYGKTANKNGQFV